MFGAHWLGPRRGLLTSGTPCGLSMQPGGLSTNRAASHAAFLADSSHSQSKCPEDKSAPPPLSASQMPQRPPTVRGLSRQSWAADQAAPPHSRWESRRTGEMGAGTGAAFGKRHVLRWHKALQWWLAAQELPRDAASPQAGPSRCGFQRTRCSVGPPSPMLSPSSTLAVSPALWGGPRAVRKHLLLREGGSCVGLPLRVAVRLCVYLGQGLPPCSCQVSPPHSSRLLQGRGCFLSISPPLSSVGHMVGV